MRRTIALIVVTIFALGLFTLAVSDELPGKIKIAITGIKPAAFDHAAHVALASDCQKCHHSSEKGKGEKCTNCHTKEGKDKADPGKKAFHEKCIGCHKEMDKGPRLKDCDVCHPKEK